MAPGKLSSVSKYPKILALLFVLTLPLVNPWVRGDGVGYYAYIRSLLIDHDLDFENEWRAGNQSFLMFKVDANGKLDRSLYTSTGHLDNHFTVGPSMLWAPFLVPLHLAMVALQRLGFVVKPDGFSKPYIVTVALATAMYGFLGLLLSFRLARLYVEERWAFLATLGIWFASSLPVYMYFNPSWSHAHSAFVVALFLWYWQHTRQERTLVQCVILGLLSGLMIDVYYPNIVVLLMPFLESLRHYGRAWRAPGHDWTALRRLVSANLLYSLMSVMAFLPTMITRQIIYGHPLQFGYGGLEVWHWRSPELAGVLFSSDHGLLTWTPILIPAVAGLVLFWKYDHELATHLIFAFLAFYYLVASHYNWDGLSSFGNRFFISLTAMFVLGLSVSFSELAKWLTDSRAAQAAASVMTSLLIVWNWAFIFQWGTHLVPARGPISWKQMAFNQFRVVPKSLVGQVKAYFANRGALMQRIEREDIRQLREQTSKDD